MYSSPQSLFMSYLPRESSHTAGVSPNGDGTHNEFKVLCVFKEYTH